MGRLCLLQSHQIDAHGVTWQFHPVVQDWAQNRQGHDTFETLALLALKILQCSLEDYENGSVLEPNYSGKTYQGLRPHVEACYQNCKKIFLEKRPGSSLVEQGLTCAINRMANFFSFDGRYDVAKELQRKLADVSTQGSPEHKWALRQLANTLIRDRQLLEAAKLQEEAVRAQADEDVEYAFQLLELSMTYRHQALNPRQFPDARKSIQDSLDLGFKALDILRKLKGDTSLEVASALADLAITEYHAGNLDRARELGENALSIKATILGAESSTTLDAKNSLAVTIAKQGNCDTAARMHEEVRDIRLSAVGPCHPDTMRTELWLARAWRLGGHVKKARALNEELLQKSLGQFGHDHPDTQSAAMGLWRCLITQGLIQEADRVQREYGLLLKTVEEKMREEALAIHG